MQLFRKRALLKAWHAIWLKAMHKRALLSKALAHMRLAMLPAVLNGWRQYWLMKSSLRGRAQAAREHVHSRRKHLLLRAWHTVQQKAQHKKALLSRALAFMRHAVLPAAFQSWRQYSHAKRSRHGRADSAMRRVQSVWQLKVLTAWHAAQLKARQKRELLRRAVAHMQQAIVPATFTAWAKQAAWLANARKEILHCLQVSL